MRLTFRLLLPLLFLFSACDETSTPTNDEDRLPISNESSNNVDTSTNLNASDTLNSNTVLTDVPPATHNCTITDKHLDKNIFWAQDQQLLFAIVANDETYDKDLGDSHRILEVYNTKNCERIFQQTLPVNRSPDFPYYLAPGTYESKNEIVAIQGFANPYFFDCGRKRLSQPLEPEYLSEREAVDAQSGMIKGLTVWGNYLLGHAVDFGPFAFDIRNTARPKPVPPVAEYPIPKTAEFRYLFLLEEANGRYQAILPVSDFDAGGSVFELQKLFPQAIKTDPKLPKNVRNNRYLVFRDQTDPTQEKRVVVDMFGQRYIPLPENIALQKTTDILEWLKTN